MSCGVRIAYDKFVELSNNLKEKEYLFHDDLEQLYNMYLTIITLTRYNELMGKPKLKDFLNMAYEFAKKYED